MLGGANAAGEFCGTLTTAGGGATAIGCVAGCGAKLGQGATFCCGERQGLEMAAGADGRGLYMGSL